MRLRFEAWTTPSSGTHTKLFNFTPLTGASGVRELSAYRDARLPVSVASGLADTLAGRWIKVFLGDTLIDEFEVSRAPRHTRRPGVIDLSGPQRNGVVEWGAILPPDYPNHKDGVLDWSWASTNVLPPLGLGDLASVKAVYTLVVDASAGSFTLTVDGDTTENLDYNVTAFVLEGSSVGTPFGLQGLNTVQDVTVTGAGTDEDPFVITFYNPPNPGAVSVDDSGLTGTATLTLVTEGGLDPAPITISKPADQQAGDPADYGNYGVPPISVVSDVVDTGADYSILVKALTQFAGSQVVFKVTPGETYSGTKVRVRPTVAGNFAIVARTIFGDLIARNEVALTADTFQDLTLPQWVAPTGTDQAILRVAAVDSTPENIADFYVNWQGASVFRGQPQATPTKILRELVESIQSRGTLEFLHLDFTDPVDSNSTALTEQGYLWRFGETHLGHVLDDWKLKGYQWRVVPCSHEEEGKTHDLQFWYAPDGEIRDLTETTDPVVRQSLEATRVTRSRSRSVLYGHGSGSLIGSAEDSTAVSAIGRRERIVDTESSTTDSQISAALSAVFAEDERNAEALSVRVDGRAQHIPGRDYVEGDLVKWQLAGLTAMVEKPVARFGWTHGEVPQFEVSASRVLSADGGMAEAVDWLLRQPYRRRGGGDGGSVVALPAPSDTSSGAYIHLGDAAGQEIDAGGEAVTFTSILKTPLNFAVTAPTDEVLIQVPGYYDFGLDFAWDTWLRGGTVLLRRTRGGPTTTVWPPGTQWTAPAGRTCLGIVAKGIEAQPGDTFQWVVDHGDESAQDLAWAYTSIELVDRTTPQVASPSTVDVAYATYENNVADLAEPHEVPLPSHEAGDLLCMVIHSDSGVSTINTPTGWTQLGLSTGSNGRAGWFYKVSAGTEGSSVDVTTDAGEGFRGLVAITWRVRSSVDYSSEGPAFDDVNGSLTVPSVDANHGNARYLSFVAVGSKRTYDWSGPDGYTPIVEEQALGELSANVEIVCYLASAEVVTSGTVTPGTIAFGGQTGGGAGVEYRPGHVLVKVGDS